MTIAPSFDPVPAMPHSGSPRAGAPAGHGPSGARTTTFAACMAEVTTPTREAPATAACDDDRAEADTVDRDDAAADCPADTASLATAQADPNPAAASTPGRGREGAGSVDVARATLPASTRDDPAGLNAVTGPTPASVEAGAATAAAIDAVGGGATAHARGLLRQSSEASATALAREIDRDAGDNALTPQSLAPRDGAMVQAGEPSGIGRTLDAHPLESGSSTTAPGGGVSPHAPLAAGPTFDRTMSAALADTAATTASAALAAPFDSPFFVPSLAHQLRWWADEGVQSAMLSLNPAEMGPVAVEIVVHDGRHASIDFSATRTDTRQALERALPALAAALDERGLTLTNGGVHDGSARGHAQPDAGPRGRAGAARATTTVSTDVAAAVAATGSPRMHGSGLLHVVA